jgi:hypothetical protein
MQSSATTDWQIANLATPLTGPVIMTVGNAPNVIAQKTGMQKMMTVVMAMATVMVVAMAVTMAVMKAMMKRTRKMMRMTTMISWVV